MPKKKSQEAHHGIKKGNASTNPDRIAKGKGMRTQSTIKRLNMYRSTPIRDKKGAFIAGAFMSRDLPTQPFVEPNRKWFGMLLLLFPGLY
jgi:nuclear GTP-binding protein